MCGICGSSDDPSGSRVSTMNAVLVHRGPDDSGVYTDQACGFALGATRLSIIDVDGGHQPLANEDGSVVAVLNGEIYNHPALMDRLRARGHSFSSRTDTEVLVHLYEDYGDDLVHALDGMFAFAVWDQKRRRLVIARDRFGEKPLFYSARAGQLAFASELTALLASGRVATEVDAQQLDAYFVLGYVPGPGTLIDGVRQLPPGHRLVWENGRTSVEPYWRPMALDEDLPTDHDELVVETEMLLGEAVRSRLVSDVPLGVFLSGGVDSSLVASFAAEASAEPLCTFTVGYDVGTVSELAPARVAADVLGADHHELVLASRDVEPLARSLFERLDQPVADQALLASFAVCRFAREHVKVVVGGEGADELFGGYPRYRWLALADKMDRHLPEAASAGLAAAFDRLPVSGRLSRLSHVLERRSAVDRHLEWVTDGRAGLRDELYGERLRPTFAGSRLEDTLLASGADAATAAPRKFMVLDQILWLPDDVLAKADRASMLASLEVRTPFLEPRLAAFAASVSGRYHVGRGGKRLLRAVLDRRVPDLRRGRGKMAFRVPADEWLRGPLALVLREQVRSNPLYEEGWIRRSKVERLIDDHLESRRNCAEVLWPLMVLGFWMSRLTESVGV